ncbi:MAG TPA: hypothetical protein VFS79_10545, partial [Arthrobacter sp.]|nr:hypothetical protein [Arthrobacter sp.]
RVSLLQSIREFARNRLALLAAEPGVRRRHAEHYVVLAEAVSPLLWGQDQVDAFRTLHADALDFRAALLWAAGPRGSTELALRLVGQLWHYWELTGDFAEQQRTAVALVEAAPDAPPELRGPALSGAATLSWVLGRYDQAADLHGLALRAFRETGNASAIAWTTMCLGVQAAQRGDTATAARIATEVLSLPHASHLTRLSALILLSRLAFYGGDHEQALELSRQCVELSKPLRDSYQWRTVLTNLAESTEQAGDLDGAESLLLEALNAGLPLGALGNLVGVLESLAGVYAAQKHLERAARLLGAADSHRKEQGPPLYGEELVRVQAITARVRAEAGPIRFGLAWAGGRNLTLRQAVNEVLQGAHHNGLPPGAAPDQADAHPSSPEDVLDPAPWSGP